MISGKAKITGVIGDPIEHSLSPIMHNYWLKQNNIDGAYIPIKIKAENLSAVLNSIYNMNFKGINVTIPHKEEVYQFIKNSPNGVLTNNAKIIGAVNTISFEKDKIFGDSSDGEGFLMNIRNHNKDKIFHSILLLGAGGATRSIILSLIKEAEKLNYKTNIIISNRTQENALLIKNEFENKLSHLLNYFSITVLDFVDKEKVLSDVDLLVNTTSLGMTGKDCLEIDIKTLNKDAIVSDIIYKPLMTKLLIDAKENGNQIVTGIGMLINQALVGFEKWYGIKPIIDKDFLEYFNKFV